MIGTRAPSARPALSAWARSEMLCEHVARLGSGTSRMSGSPATSTGSLHLGGLLADRAVEGHGPSSRPPGSARAPPSCIARRRRASPAFRVTVSTAARIATGRRDAERDGQVDRVWQMSSWHPVGRDVDRRVGDDQHLVVGRPSMMKTCSAGGPCAGPSRARRRCAQLVRVQAALHSAAGAALARQLHRLVRGGVAVRSITISKRPRSMRPFSRSRRSWPPGPRGWA